MRIILQREWNGRKALPRPFDLKSKVGTYKNGPLLLNLINSLLNDFVNI